VKLVHRVGFITKKFVTMHGHMKVQKRSVLLCVPNWLLTMRLL